MTMLFKFATNWLKNSRMETPKKEDEKNTSATIYIVDEHYHEVFQYQYLPTYNNKNDDYMISFYKIENVVQLIGKLLLLLDELGFEAIGVTDVWMNDEIWISAKSVNGGVTITRDIYDLVFILADNNRTDLDLIEKAMEQLADFKRIEP